MTTTRTRPRARLRATLGTGPLHLLTMLASFTLATAAALHINHDPLRLRYALWFIGAAVAHDLILFPLYALLDRTTHHLLHRTPRRTTHPARPGDINYLRFPATLSLLLLLVFSPAILHRSQDSLHYTSTLTEDPFLTRWLLITGTLFLTSALLYTLRGRRPADGPGPADPG